MALTINGCYMKSVIRSLLKRALTWSKNCGDCSILRVQSKTRLDFMPLYTTGLAGPLNNLVKEKADRKM
jgi:hypothetical protein